MKSQNSKVDLLEEAMHPYRSIEERTFDFSIQVISFVGENKIKAPYWSLSDQLFRSGTSIGANVIEAKGSSSRKEMVRFFEIALRSANETKYWLKLISKIDSEIDITRIYDEVDQISKILGSSIIKLKASLVIKNTK